VGMKMRKNRIEDTMKEAMNILSPIWEKNAKRTSKMKLV